jgi:hypothetical protein
VSRSNAVSQRRLDKQPRASRRSSALLSLSVRMREFPLLQLEPPIVWLAPRCFGIKIV